MVPAAAGEQARREALGELEHRQAPPAADVEHPDASLETVDEARHKRQDVRFEGRQHGHRAVLRHHLMEAGVALVGHAAAAPEVLDTVADMLIVLFEGAFVISRSTPGPGVFAAQLGAYRAFLQLLFDATGAA